MMAATEFECVYAFYLMLSSVDRPRANKEANKKYELVDWESKI